MLALGIEEAAMGGPRRGTESLSVSYPQFECIVTAPCGTVICDGSMRDELLLLHDMSFERASEQR